MRRGDIVVALKALDPAGANVGMGERGVVFEEANEYGDKGGPMVRWMSGGACNVYAGDVAPAPCEHTRIVKVIGDPKSPSAHLCECGRVIKLGPL